MVVFVAAWVPLKKQQMVKRILIIHRELGSCARGCGSWLQGVEAAAKLVPE